jgi:hypothetical protein
VLKLNPAGKFPVIDQVTGVSPADSTNVWVYAEPTVALNGESAAITGATPAEASEPHHLQREDEGPSQLALSQALKVLAIPAKSIKISNASTIVGVGLGSVAARRSTF